MIEDNVTRTQVVLARQPIVDNDLSVFAYELLYRKTAEASEAGVLDDVGATAQVISASLFEIGMNNLVGDSKAFVNFPREYLLDPNGLPLEKEKVVVEVLENVGYDAVLLASLRRWAKAGYSLALDDFVYEPKLAPFVELADYIKLDFRELGKEEFQRQFESLKPFNLKILAEKVETWDEFHFCQELGVDLYQGYFYEKPEVVSSKTATINKVTLLQLMAQLLDADASDVSQLEKIVSQDAALVHKLLRYLNSPASGVINSVDSIKKAILLIGSDQLKAMTNVLLMSEMIGGRQALVEQILIRAKHAELYAEKMRFSESDKYFLAGMLSMIDVCTGEALDIALSSLPLPQEFTQDIINRTGIIGETLDLVEKYSHSEDLEQDANIEILKASYIQAIKWGDSFLSSF